MNTLNTNIGKRLANLRNNLRMTQKDVACKLNLQGLSSITYKSLSKYEKGDNAVPLDVLLALCELYHADLDYILKGKKPNPLSSSKELEEMQKNAESLYKYFTTLLSEIQ